MAMILDAFVGKFLERLVSLIEEKAIMMLGVKEDLRKIQRLMVRLQGVFEDAERRRMEEHATNNWLCELRDVMYDADDIFDDCLIKCSQLLDEHSSSSSNSSFKFSFLACCLSAPQRYDISERISNLYGRLDEIYKDKKQLKLVVHNHETAVTKMKSRETAPTNVEVVGREFEKATKHLIKLMTGGEGREEVANEREGEGRRSKARGQGQGRGHRQYHSVNNHHRGGSGGDSGSHGHTIGAPSANHPDHYEQSAAHKQPPGSRMFDGKSANVYAITGMGGIGKTTLAQKIFNHQKVQTKFEIKAWICVSQNYNEIDLLKRVIRATKADYGNVDTRAELEPLLGSAVNGKSVFLVLDDVWIDNVWIWIDLLRRALHSAHIDSSILITTRDEKVANEMGSTYIHRVNLLPDETGWEMLSRSLVMLGKGEEEVYNLSEIGIQIIKKCHGLPLAIKAMVGVLSSKDLVEAEWKKILNNSAWSTTKLREEISGALYLSYSDLPSPLKQCFLYCSLFPEDSWISREDIVRLWVAEGFIKEEGGSTSMEDTADEYFYELIRRNLLQPVDVTISKILHLETYKCKMHDLFRDLCLFISRDESFSGNITERSVKPLTKLRRVALTWGGNVAGFISATTELKCLRTLINFEGPTLDFKLLERFLHLRVLMLADNEIECIPDSIGDLVHLRLLDLSRTLIRQLPESIGHLSNLQYLNLRQCMYLTILPRSITQVQKLRCLILTKTPLRFIPKGIERLKQLNHIQGFVVGDDSVSNEEEHNTLKELSSLSNLRTLYIYNLERARSTDTLVLRDLSQLKELHLSCDPSAHSNEQNNTETEILSIEKLFEELVPTKSLELLSITNYFGHNYPKWMTEMSLGSCLSDLSTLSLSGNISTPHLPPLGQLPNLRLLHINGSDAVKRIGPEFLGQGVAAARSEHRKAFPKLQVLVIDSLRNLEEWFFSNEEKDKNDDSPKLELFHSLDELKIKNCPKLRSLPSGLVRTGLKKLHIEENPSLERISNLPALKWLSVRNCYALKYVEGFDGLDQLNLYQEFVNCLPEWLPRLIEEQVIRKETLDEEDFLLQLWCNEVLLRKCEIGGEYWDFIQQTPRLNADVHVTGYYYCNSYFENNKFSVVHVEEIPNACSIQ